MWRLHAVKDFVSTWGGLASRSLRRRDSTFREGCLRIREVSRGHSTPRECSEEGSGRKGRIKPSVQNRRKVGYVRKSENNGKLPGKEQVGNRRYPGSEQHTRYGLSNKVLKDLCMYFIQGNGLKPPSTDRYARWCERSGWAIAQPSYSIDLSRIRIRRRRMRNR